MKESRKRFRERLRRLSAMLMAAVMLASSAPLFALAEGEELQPKCGLVEHTHGPECYQSVLTCGKDQAATALIIGYLPVAGAQ